MAFHYVASLLVLIAVAAAGSDFAKEVKEAQVLGDSVPKVLEKQWASKLAQQKKNISSAEAALCKSLPGLVRADVTAAVKQLIKVEQKIEAELSKFAKLQSKQATEISKKYHSFLAARLSAKSTDESAIHKIREESQKTVNSWVPALSKIHEAAHKLFENTVRSVAAKCAKSKNPQIGDQIRVAFTNVGIQLLNVLVEEQNADTALLTGVQFNLFNNFFQKAETVLIELLVFAKSGQHSGASQSKSGTQTASHVDSSQSKYGQSSSQPKPAPVKASETKPTYPTSSQTKTVSTGKTSSNEEFDYDEYQD